MHAPVRLGANPNRHVLIVVHALEYDQYTNALANTGTTVIGWEFKRNSRRWPVLTGFGASRYEAIEFCKRLRANVTTVRRAAPWDIAWLLYDNGVGANTLRKRRDQARWAWFLWTHHAHRSQTYIQCRL